MKRSLGDITDRSRVAVIDRYPSGLVHLVTIPRLNWAAACDIKVKNMALKVWCYKSCRNVKIFHTFAATGHLKTLKLNFVSGIWYGPFFSSLKKKSFNDRLMSKGDIALWRQFVKTWPGAAVLKNGMTLHSFTSKLIIFYWNSSFNFEHLKEQQSWADISVYLF